jgi:hypothetical protein
LVPPVPLVLAVLVVLVVLLVLGVLEVQASLRSHTDWATAMVLESASE